MIFPFDWKDNLDIGSFGFLNFKPSNEMQYHTSPEHHGFILNERCGFKIIFCEDCGFIHVANPPERNALNKFYRDKFYTQDRKRNYITAQSEARDWWNTVYKDRLTKLEGLLGRTGRILDVGCGPGFFLKFAEEHGWEVCGLEPSSSAVKFAQDKLKLNVMKLSLESYFEQNASEEFDVIYSHGVLEHVLDPINFLNRSKDLLTENGLIFSSVANDFNPVQYSFLKRDPQKKPWWIIPPEHLNHFTSASIHRLFRNCGLKVKSRQSSFPIDFFLLMGIDYVDRPNEGSKCHEYRENLEMSLINSDMGFLKDHLYEFLASCSVGRQVDIIGAKNE